MSYINSAYVTGRPCGSVAQWSECSHGMREVLGSSPGRSMCFFLPCDIWWSVWVRGRAASSKGTVSSIPAWFRADSETNLIKQGEIVTGRPCGSVAQWSHGMRKVLGSSPGRAICFVLPCDTYNFSNFIPLQNIQPMMSFPEQGPFGQGAQVFGVGTYPPSQSPTQMTSCNMPPSQALLPPSWATELINDVKQMRKSLTKLDEIEKTVNLIHMEVTDLETKVKTVGTRVNTVESPVSSWKAKMKIEKGP